MITNIVFTKNRPLQLEAYLQSLCRFFSRELIQTYIIYKVELFEDEYEQVFHKYSDCVVIKENDFHSDFLTVLSKVDTKYILFGVDDVVYFDCVDFDVIDETFTKYAGDIFGFSLRLGINAAKDDIDTLSEAVMAGQTVYSLDWTQGRTPNTRYPFELCATIYTTALVKKIIGSAMNSNSLIRGLFSPGSTLMKLPGTSKIKRKILKRFGYFFNPNTFESWNCRWSKNHSEGLPSRLYFQKLCASAIQVNMVNVPKRNRFDKTAEHTVEVLNEKYKTGYRFDIDFVSKNKPMATHCGVEHFSLKRS
ncbi:MAG: hypothetical protein ACYSUX_06465 [Planctomycetota bacterium]